jgi:RNA polymerase sigma factor for flagellar operon FliA
MWGQRVMREDEQFVREYEGFVRGVALQTRSQLGLDTPVEDLIAYAYQGLLEARQRFDSSKGVAFKSYAYFRVRGAVLDGVRSMARLPRRAYARLKAAEALDQSTEAAGEGHAAAPQPLATDAKLRAIDSIMGRVAAAYAVAVSAEDAAEGAGSPEEALLHQEQLKCMRLALEKLPERERHMIEGHYFKNKQFDTLSAELGISKSWGSRLHAHALDLLRLALTEPEPED